MECPRCKRVGSVIKLTFKNEAGAAHAPSRVAALIADYPGAVVRSRVCKGCAFVWPTIEIWMEGPPVPEEFARDPMKMCDHSLQCMRTGKFLPTRRCLHKGQRCTKHRCKYCEALPDETAFSSLKTDSLSL